MGEVVCDAGTFDYARTRLCMNTYFSIKEGCEPIIEFLSVFPRRSTHMYFALLTTFFILITPLLVWIEYRRQRLNDRFRLVPGPPQLPIIGSIYSVRPNKLTEIVECFDQLMVAPTVKLVFGGKLLLFVTDPNHLAQIFPTKIWLERSYIFDLFELKSGMLAAKYKFWKPYRKFTSHCFSQRSVLDMIPTFNKHVDILCKKLEEHVDEQVFDFNELTIKMSIDQVLENLFGCKNPDPSINGDVFEELEDAISARMINPLYMPWITFRLSYMYKIHKLSRYMLRKVIQPIVDEKLKAMKYGENDTEKPTFIDEVLNFEFEGKKLEGEELIENLGSMFMAGYETSGLTVAYGILMLAMHPEYEEKLLKEILANYKPGTLVDYETIKNMPYIDMIVKETLRHFPAVPITEREALAPCEIQGLGKIQKGETILINFHKLHHWPQFWGEHTFDFYPDNFLPENVAKRHPYAFQPFSGGARNCIGLNYAMMSVKIALIKILTQYQFTTKMTMKDLVLKFSITLKLDNGHMVQVKKRVLE